MSQTEQSCPGAGSVVHSMYYFIITIPGRYRWLHRYSPRQSSPVRGPGARSTPCITFILLYLTDIVDYADTVPDRVVLSGGGHGRAVHFMYYFSHMIPGRYYYWPLCGHCPEQSNPVWGWVGQPTPCISLLLWYLADIVDYTDTVPDRAVLSGGGQSGPLHVRRTDGHVGGAVVLHELDWDLNRENARNKSSGKGSKWTIEELSAIYRGKAFSKTTVKGPF